MLYFRGETFIFRGYRIGVANVCYCSCHIPIFISISQIGPPMSTKALLYDLIDQSQPAGHTHVLDPDEVTIGDPTIDIVTGHNTKIQLTAIPGSGYSGSIFVYYSRESIGNVGLPTQTMSEVNFTIQSILDWLNQHLLIKIELNDLEQFTLPVMNVGDIVTLRLTAKSESVAWIGSTEIALLYGLPPNVEELSQLMNFDLPLAM